MRYRAEGPAADAAEIGRAAGEKVRRNAGAAFLRAAGARPDVQCAKAGSGDAAGARRVGDRAAAGRAGLRADQAAAPGDSRTAGQRRRGPREGSPRSPSPAPTRSATRRGELLRRLAALPCFAVGDTTGSIARAAGFSNVIEGQGDAESLADTVIAKRPAGPVVYLCGRVRRPLFEQRLTGAGITVVPVETYDTVTIVRTSRRNIGVIGRQRRSTTPSSIPPTRRKRWSRR